MKAHVELINLSIYYKKIAKISSCIKDILKDIRETVSIMKERKMKEIKKEKDTVLRNTAYPFNMNL